MYAFGAFSVVASPCSSEYLSRRPGRIVCHTIFPKNSFLDNLPKLGKFLRGAKHVSAGFLCPVPE